MADQSRTCGITEWSGAKSSRFISGECTVKVIAIMNDMHGFCSSRKYYMITIQRQLVKYGSRNMVNTYIIEIVETAEYIC